MSHNGPIIARASTVTVVPAKLLVQISDLLRPNVACTSPNNGVMANHLQKKEPALVRKTSHNFVWSECDTQPNAHLTYMMKPIKNPNHDP